ncbi:type II secretion system GspH family protein [Patescibacteria group bacterium]|nr:type II secretion system GspH family protein [Patescibacteria group bacterium]
MRPFSGEGKTGGFTLIEMLVVVAIIGILSSVILTALGPARNKAKDARIIEEVNQARAIAEASAVNGSYSSLQAVRPDNISSITDPNLQSLASDIAAQGGGLYIEKSIYPPYTWYTVFSVLNAQGGPQSNEAQYYCVDSGGHAVTTLTNPDGVQGGCPAS